MATRRQGRRRRGAGERPAARRASRQVFEGAVRSQGKPGRPTFEFHEGSSQRGRGGGAPARDGRVRAAQGGGRRGARGAARRLHLRPRGRVRRGRRRLLLLARLQALPPRALDPGLLHDARGAESLPPLRRGEPHPRDPRRVPGRVPARAALAVLRAGQPERAVVQGRHPRQVLQLRPLLTLGVAPAARAAVRRRGRRCRPTSGSATATSR